MIRLPCGTILTILYYAQNCNPTSLINSEDFQQAEAIGVVGSRFAEFMASEVEEALLRIILDYIHHRLCSVIFYLSRLPSEGPSLEETASGCRQMLETVFPMGYTPLKITLRAIRGKARITAKIDHKVICDIGLLVLFSQKIQQSFSSAL